MPDIISKNQLVQDDRGVFRFQGKETETFAYSDGEQSEQYLHGILTKANDLSSRSAELQSKIIDWPSEYHLSSDRSNLLRPFNLEGVQSVLELGSGCCAISRYLGELGIQVDAVEGSRIRAGLGKLRCRDLENVRVINANYNELDFPRGYYDLVVFVGVIEYARKFHPDTASDEQAALATLSMAQDLLNSTGVVLVAIENRLGLKYLLGAHEDHYGHRYVGVNGYIDSAGIVTYSRPQWKEMVKKAGFAHNKFSYPFPDYKIPSVVLGENYLAENRYAGNHLEGILSRDYYAPVKRSPTETICWQGASHGGFLGDLSNSFCVLMGNDQNSIARIQNFDFCHGPGSSRKNQYAVTTRKPEGQNVVDKIPYSRDVDGSPISQNLAQQPFIEGALLSGQWLRTILIYVRRDEFEQDIRRYFEFLSKAERNETLKIDLLPINILVTENGQWQEFDQEWEVSWPLNKEYLLFRALLTFIVSNWIYLKDFLGWLELQTVRDFIEFGFHSNKIHLGEYLDQFIEMENRFQKTIAREGSEQDVTRLLATVFDFSASSDKVYSALYWRADDQEFSSGQSNTQTLTPSPETQTLRFSIPAEATVKAIRLDPFDIRKTTDVGFFRLDKLSLLEKTAGEIIQKWQLDNSSDIADAARLSSAVFVSTDDSSSWMATTDFPKLEFLLPHAIVSSSDSEAWVEVELGVIRSLDYALAYNRYLVSVEQTAKIEDRGQRNLQAMQSILATMQTAQDKLESIVSRQQQDIVNQQQEIDGIKQSRAFLVGSSIVGSMAKLTRIVARAKK